MHSRRLVKRSVPGSRVCAPSPTGDGAALPGLVQAVKPENRDPAAGPRRNVYTVLMQDGSVREYSEEEIVVSPAQMTVKGALKSRLKKNEKKAGHADCQGMNKGVMMRRAATGRAGGGGERPRIQQHKRTRMTLDVESDHSQNVRLLECKDGIISIRVSLPHFRKSAEEVDMDKVTAAMVLTSLSTSPLVRSPPVRLGEGANGSWKEGGFMPSSHSSSGYWSWSAPSDQSNPSTPSPPLSEEKVERWRSTRTVACFLDDVLSHKKNLAYYETAIFGDKKNSMKVMFKCLWKNCGKVLSTAAGIQKHIRTVHLGRNCESECSDGEEDFYYTEIKLNTDSVAEGLSSLSPVSPSVLSPSAARPGAPEPGRPETASARGEGGKLATPLSRSAPSTLYLVHTDHAYQATAPVNIPSSTNFTPNGSGSFSISWQSPPVTFTGIPASPTHSRSQSFVEQRPQASTVLSSPPRAAGGLSRKSRGEGRKCRKVYGMENRDMWCTACRWKKACQRFVD
uniref:Zinc finger protein 704 n=1 Tax=Lepisosteus oculatus TaxID=7918 RepID=W5M4M8_LEPOC